MYRCFTSVLLLCVLHSLTFAGATFADLRFSPPPKKKDTSKVYTLEVKLGKDNRVSVPRGVLRTAAIDDNSKLETRTVVAGVALSMALISFVFIRPKKGRSLLIVGLIFGVMALGVAQMAIADIRLPRNRRPKTKQVQLETARRGTKVTITLDRETLRQLNKQAGNTGSAPKAPTSSPAREKK